jgi:hypothetical protein
LKHYKLLEQIFIASGYKTSETLLGIETPLQPNTPAPIARYKTSETLLGIETFKRLS